MKCIYIAAYNPASQSARSLRDIINEKGVRARILKRPDRSRYRQKADHFVINWGISDNRYGFLVPSINYAVSVLTAANKQAAYERMRDADVCVPEVAYTAQEAHQFGRVMCRTLLRAHSGRGLYYYDVREGGELPEQIDGQNVRLYVKYVPKQFEYRVHVMQAQTIDVQRKARRNDVPDEEVDWQIRNHSNGFIFARNEALGDVPDAVQDQAVAAVQALGLHYGAVDIGYHERYGAVVYEVNTAPGLSGTTLDSVSDKIIDTYTAL